MEKMLTNFLKFFEKLFNLFLHAFFVSMVVYFAWPILSLYWNQKPAVGIDLFLSVDFVTYIHNHFNWPWASWKYIWYGGTPLAQTYPLLHFYLMQPLLHWFSAVAAVQVYVLASYVLFFVSSYLLFYSLSRSRPFSALLVIACAYSFNLWSQLYWAGSIPYTATLFLLPLSLFLVHRGYESGNKQSFSPNKKYLYFSALLTGTFILGHPQSFIGYTVPLTTIFILFFWDKKTKIFHWGKIFTLFIYGLIVLAVGFPMVGTGLVIFKGFVNIINSLFAGVSTVSQEGVADSAAATSGTLNPVERMGDIYTRSNPLLFWALGISFAIALITLVLVVIVRRRFSHNMKLLLPFSLMFAYTVIFIFSFAKGLNPIAGGWYRVFWPTMTVLGSLAAVLWRTATNNLEIIIEDFLGKSFTVRVPLAILTGFIGLAVFFVGNDFLQTTYLSFQKETLGLVSESSAFPTVLSLDLGKDQWPQKLPKLTPDWINPNDMSYRLYDMDATVNIWWSSVFKLPLARGYLDAAPTGPDSENYSGWQYLQNITFSKDEVVERYDYTVDQARAMAAFFIDWHAIKYWEGAPVYGRNYASAPSSYIGEDKDLISQSESVFTKRPARYFQIEGRGWDIPETDQELKYYEVNEALTSPIYMGSNAPSILVIGDRIGQDTVMRDLGLLNINSRRGIIVQWNEPIDKLGKDDMANFDVVFAYRYKYNSYGKAFRRLEDYVKDGGKLFIDTGTEQKESTSDNLPDVFPFEQSERKPLGKDWDWKITESEIGKGVKFEAFSEPMYDEAPWSFSYPTGALDQGTEVIAQNHSHPILAAQTIGKGKVIWSGMNFFGHVQRFKNDEEIKLLKNILFNFADFSQDKNVKVSYQRPQAEKVIIRGKASRALLFKEAAYSGWEVRVKADGFDQKLPIYQAGPMVPGYMYVVLPEQAQKGSFEAVFKYKGELVYKLTYLVSFLSIFLVLDLIFFQAIISRFLGRVLGRVQRRVGKWWEKEEEE